MVKRGLDKPLSLPSLSIQSAAWWSRTVRSLQKLLRRYPLGMLGVVIILLVGVAAIIPQHLAPYDPLRQDLLARLSPPSARHLLGTDQLGRDTLSRLIFGARISLSIAISANLLAFLVGVTLGVVSAYYGGAVDFVVMRVLDVFLAFPGILLAIAIVAVLGPGLANLTIAIAAFSVPTFARVVRSSTLAWQHQEFVQAAKAVGASDWRIITRHILLNSVGSLSVITSVRMADALLTAAGLSYLGLGAPPSVPEWGAMLNAARPNMLTHPYIILFPGLAIAVTVMAFNLMAQMLTDTADPFKRRF